jgi:hypothetical protein
MRQKLLTPCEVSSVGMNIAMLRCNLTVQGCLVSAPSNLQVSATSMRSHNSASADRVQSGMYLKSFFVPSASEIKPSQSQHFHLLLCPFNPSKVG